MVYVEDTFTNKISILFLSNDTNLILFDEWNTTYNFHIKA